MCTPARVRSGGDGLDQVLDGPWPDQALVCGLRRLRRIRGSVLVCCSSTACLHFVVQLDRRALGSGSLGRVPLLQRGLSLLSVGSGWAPFLGLR